ncbi:hypothetical protein M885DRAFT_558 [Pelagophyceae sp. CCMP2097]|nr:hypothetical protein M885DRAFT_558 [Pelagophyceae sp. CCMP2097]
MRPSYGRPRPGCIRDGPSCIRGRLQMLRRVPPSKGPVCKAPDRSRGWPTLAKTGLPYRARPARPSSGGVLPSGPLRGLSFGSGPFCFGAA